MVGPIRICRVQRWCSFYWVLYSIPFLDKLGTQNQNCQFKLKFATSTYSNMKNAMVLFTFSVLDRKHPFWANLVHKIKIVSLSCNVVPRLILICRIQWWCSVFLFYAGNTLFWWMKVSEARLLSLQPYERRDLEIGSCRQRSFFILLGWMPPGLFLCTVLKFFE